MLINIGSRKVKITDPDKQRNLWEAYYLDTSKEDAIERMEKHELLDTVVQVATSSVA